MAISFKDIQWKETLFLNFFRSVVAGVFFGILMLFTGGPASSGMPTWLFALSMPLGFPVCYFIFFLPVGCLSMLLARMEVPAVGALSTMFALIFLPVDIIMFIIHKTHPELVPLEKYTLWPPAFVIFVMPGDWIEPAIPTASATETTQANDRSNCPFAGRVIAEAPMMLLGFNWGSQETIFDIHKDWKVTTPKDGVLHCFGWVDVDGYIHKEPMGHGATVNPEARLSGTTVAKISGDACYNDGKKIGKFSRS